MYNYCSDYEVSKYVGWHTHRSLIDTKMFIQQIIQDYRENNAYFWGIVWKETNQLIGTINFVTINEKHKRGELGYILSKEFWNKGIMTEAVKLVLDFGFKSLNLNRIEAKCLVEN